MYQGELFDPGEENVETLWDPLQAKRKNTMGLPRLPHPSESKNPNTNSTENSD